MASIADPPVPVNLDLWDVTFAKLASNDQQALRSGLGIPVTIEDVRASIAEARGKADKKWTIKGQCGDVNLRVHFDKVIHWVQEFVAIGDTIVTYDPGHAALPWAAMRFLLQILVNNSEKAAGFISGLNELAFYVYFCTKVECRFLRDESYEEKLELENRIIGLYSTIFQFMLKARQYFETSPATTNLKSRNLFLRGNGRSLCAHLMAARFTAGLHKPTDGITKKLSLAESQFQKILIVSTFINTQLQEITRDAIKHLSKSHTESMASLKSQLEDLLRLQRGKFTNSEITLHGVRELVVRQKVRTLSSLVHIIRLIIRVRKAVNFIDGEEYKQYDRTAILRWLSTIPYQDHQTVARKEVQDGTGRWFLQDDAYRAWKASDETSLLWLHGPPGCGKSKLMSLAIEEALNGGADFTDAGVFYFHCSNNSAEPERADFGYIIRCLVKQGSSGGTPTKPRKIPRYVVRAFKAAEVNGFASRHLSEKDCCAIMSKYAIDHRRMIIFLDALDECESEERDKIMNALNLVVERSGGALVKLLVSSRDDVLLGTLLHKHKQFEIHIEENRNQQDIDRYVKAQLSQLIEHKKLRVLGRKGIPKELQAQITSRLSQGAQGMFRWVSLQFEYLCTLKTKHDIENRLGQLPPKLIDTYGELFRRKTESYGPEHRRILDLALSSLLLPIRPDATIFAEMLFALEKDEPGDEDECSGGSETDRSASGTVNRAQTLQGPEAVTELCFNLVVFDSTSSVFRFAHTSVQDYLSMHENGYYASPEMNSARMAEHCISLLLHIPNQIHEMKQASPQSGKQQEQTVCEPRSEDAITADTSFWYVQPSPAKCRTRVQRTLTWIHDKWGYFVVSSREYREKLPLKDLEVRFQQALILQPWESVNPTIFFSACQHGLVSFVETWMKKHAHLVNVCLLPAVDEKDQKLLATGLQHACSGGHSEIVERLIDEGAVIDYYSQGTPRTNALCIALQRHNTAITKLLLDKGASPSLALDTDVRFPLHWIISDGHEDAPSLVQILLEHDVDADSVDDQGMTAIALAVEKENLEIIRLLLKKKAKTTLRLSTDNGRTNILVLATKVRTTPAKSLKMVKLMLEHGLDVDSLTAEGETPLWGAAKNGNLDVARLLLEYGAFIDAQRKLGATPLIVAIGIKFISESQLRTSKPPGKSLGSAAQVQKHEDVARLLILSGANTNLRTDRGWAALHFAAMNGSHKIVELLLSHGANLNVTDSHRWTALRFAVENEYPEIVELLLRHSANPNLTDEHGGTALQVAVEKNSPEIVELLLNYNADLHAREEKQGWTALHIAARYGHESTTKLLLAYNADVKALNAYGSTALLLAAEWGHTDVVALLVDAGSELSAIDVTGVTAVHRAAREGHDKTVELLLALGADPNILSLHGIDALSDAAYSSKPEVCELLLPTTTDINSQDGYGDTALSNAIRHSQPSHIIELLLAAGAQIVPQQPGPHCSFLDHTERIKGYGNDALLMAWDKKTLDLLQTILNFAAGRDPSGEYATALVLWEKKEKEGFVAWMEARRANAPENRAEVVAFRAEIERRNEEIKEQNKQRLAKELALDLPGKE